MSESLYTSKMRLDPTEVELEGSAEYLTKIDEAADLQKETLKKEEAAAALKKEKAEELAKKEKERQATALDSKVSSFASEVERPSNSNLYESDYQQFKEAANYLADPDFIRTQLEKGVEGELYLDKLLTSLTQGIDDRESFYKSTYGSGADAPTMSTWKAAELRRVMAASGRTNFDGYSASASHEDLQARFGELESVNHQRGSVKADSEGNWAFNGADGQSRVLGETREEDYDVFNPNLTIGDPTGGYNWFLSKYRSVNFKGANDVGDFVQRSLASDDQLRADAVNFWMRQNPTDLRFEDAIKDERILGEAMDLYEEEAKEAFNSMKKSGTGDGSNNNKSNKRTSKGTALINSITEIDQEVATEGIMNPVGLDPSASAISKRRTASFASHLPMDVVFDNGDRETWKVQNIYFEDDGNDDGGSFFVNIEGEEDPRHMESGSNIESIFKQSLRAKGYSEKDMEDLFLTLAAQPKV